jgi:vacuolar-type H+-ATPase subunit F/Vma7
LMAFCSFLGDEVSAAGFRLAGVDVHVPEADGVEALFRRLLEESQLVLITAEAAAGLPADLLARALRAPSPLTLVIPDLRGRVEPPDLSSLLRHQLGMAE